MMFSTNLETKTEQRNSPSIKLLNTAISQKQMQNKFWQIDKLLTDKWQISHCNADVAPMNEELDKIRGN